MLAKVCSRFLTPSCYLALSLFLAMFPSFFFFHVFFLLAASIFMFLPVTLFLPCSLPLFFPLYLLLISHPLSLYFDFLFPGLLFHTPILSDCLFAACLHFPLSCFSCPYLFSFFDPPFPHFIHFPVFFVSLLFSCCSASLWLILSFVLFILLLWNSFISLFISFSVSFTLFFRALICHVRLLCRSFLSLSVFRPPLPFALAPSVSSLCQQRAALTTTAAEFTSGQNSAAAVSAVVAHTHRLSTESKSWV